MRHFIDIVEAMGVAHKPFRAVNTSDVVEAMLVLDDMRATVENDWCLVFGDDEPLPGDGDIMVEWSVTSSQFERLVEFYAPMVRETKKKIEPAANLALIPVTRRMDTPPEEGRDSGIHWSFGEAPNRMTDQRGDHILSGYVRNEDIDWVSTIARGLSFWDEEREISVLAGHRVQRAD